jgi:diphthine methyl ester acylhydrolase
MGMEVWDDMPCACHPCSCAARPSNVPPPKGQSVDMATDNAGNSMNPAEPQPLWTWDTGYSADSVECCPVLGWQDAFAVGTYQVLAPDDADAGDAGNSAATTQSQEPDYQSTRPATTTQRAGRLLLFQAHGSSTTTEHPLVKVEQCQALECNAILDMKWHPDIPSLVTADAKGGVSLFHLVRTPLESVQLELAATIEISSTSLILSLDWERCTSPRLISSASDGSLCVLQHAPDRLHPLLSWHAHAFEAWTAAWDASRPNVVYSGGDDAYFRGWDIRCPVNLMHEKEDEDAPLATQRFGNGKAHAAGVCSITAHPTHPHLMCTGSYDESIRLWDARFPRHPLIECPVEGGVWRLKWNPHDPSLLLAACMYNGFKVLRLDAGSLSSTDTLTPEAVNLTPIHHYQGHGSIAYGADWFHHPPLRGLVGTCSFYDHLLHVWRSPVA